ncbi:MAG: HIT family protein [Candidatus Geothermincolia bacterium]
MERIWTPWRMSYVQHIDEHRSGGCIFCDRPREGDTEESLIARRGVTVFWMLNAYPYNTAHLLISPYRHVATLDEMTEPERRELMEETALATRVLGEEFSPQGFNIGINMGRAAGAGIAEHLHLHIVPRWEGDTNFMPVLAEIKVMPELLSQTRDRIVARLASLDLNRA